MPSQPIGRNAKCPCGSGKKYKQCCLKKEHEFHEDEDGTIRRVIPMSDELGDALAERIDQMSTELGRDPEPDDRLFPDHLEHAEHQLAEAMKAAGTDPALIYAFEETGLIVSEENRDMISDQDYAAWESAVERYRSRYEQSTQSAFEYPIGTVAMYGPDDQTTTKIVASVITSADSEPILERFVGTGIADDPAVRDKIGTFFANRGVTRVAATDQNMGCPHEEGEDFPVGEDCPFCPYWKGKQGSAATLDDGEPMPEQAEMLMQNIDPDAANELVNLADQCDSEEEFVNMIMVGPCPKCESVDTRDCEDDPEIDDPTIGRCGDCGQLWCCDCDETFDNSASAAVHDCPFWESLEDGEIADDDAPF